MNKEPALKILKVAAFGLGVAVVVLNILGTPLESRITLIGLSLATLAFANIFKEE